MFGKSAVAIHSLILRATEADLSVYVGRALAAICRSRYYKRALDIVEEIENEIKQDLTHDGPFRIKRLAKESGQKPEAKKSLTFGDANGRFYTRDALPVWTSFGKHFVIRPVIRL